MVNDRRNSSVWQNLLLVRHGESTANEINRFAGKVDAPLTWLGRAQARAAGRQWSDADVDRVYVSPLLRTRQTAEILLENADLTSGEAPDVVADGRLTERHFGEFTLGNKTALQRQFGLRNYEAVLYRSSGQVAGAESLLDFRERILDFLKREVYPLLCAGKRLLVVAHKYVIELLSRLVLRLPESEGYDLRLPNGRIFSGAHLGHYVRRESRKLNHLNDFIVVNHAIVLSIAAVAGLLINAAEIAVRPPNLLLLALLGIAATISLARTAFASGPGVTGSPLVCLLRLVLRFMLLPWVVTVALVVAWPPDVALQSDYVLAIGLLLAAPAAVTAVVLSRTSGGMILPTVHAVLLSTGISLVNTVALITFFGQTDLLLQASLFVVVSSGSLLLPLLIAQGARRLSPVAVAKAAENNGALAVLALALFVVLAFQMIPLDSFYPSGLIALLLGTALRLVALKWSRQHTLYGVDDYFSMSYPNVFLLIILAGLMGNDALLNLATWFLVPMFVMSPLDDLLIRRLVHSQPRSGLFSYLRIHGDAQERYAGPVSPPMREVEQES